jgi:hypothetical protein
MGVPSLLARNPATEEAMKACGVTGVYFDADDPASLAGLMLAEDNAPGYLAGRTIIRAASQETADSSRSETCRQILFDAALRQ